MVLLQTAAIWQSEQAEPKLVSRLKPTNGAGGGRNALSVSLQVSVTVESIYWFACHSIGDAFSPESALSLLYVMSGNA